MSKSRSAKFAFLLAGISLLFAIATGASWIGQPFRAVQLVLILGLGATVGVSWAQAVVPSQTAKEGGSRGAAATVSGVVAQLRTTDLARSVEFYTGTLGFPLAFQYEDFYAGIRVGDQLFHLKLSDQADPSIPFVAAGDHLHLYFSTEDVDGAASRLRQRGVTFLKEVADTPWGTREFTILDDQGHVLCFGRRSLPGSGATPAGG